MLCNDLAFVADIAGGYTPRVADTRVVPQWLENLRLIVGTQRGDPSRVADKLGMKLSQLQKILSGENPKPQVDTLERIARACDKELEDIFARPEVKAGHDKGIGGTGNSAGVGLDPIMAGIIEAAQRLVDAEDSAPDSIEGDVLKAHAILTRAVQRIGRSHANRRAASGDDS